MKLFNVGATHRATNDARLTAANDLVQRTLAQHGLGGQAVPMGATELPAMPSINDLLSKLAAASPILRCSNRRHPLRCQLSQRYIHLHGGQSKLSHLYSCVCCGWCQWCCRHAARLHANA